MCVYMYIIRTNVRTKQKPIEPTRWRGATKRNKMRCVYFDWKNWRITNLPIQRLEPNKRFCFSLACDVSKPNSLFFSILLFAVFRLLLSVFTYMFDSIIDLRVKTKTNQMNFENNRNENWMGKGKRKKKNGTENKKNKKLKKKRKSKYFRPNNSFGLGLTVF